MFRLCGDFADNFTGGFDFVHQARTLSSEKVHGLDVANRMGCCCAVM
jgi:hypothetical protein